MKNLKTLIAACFVCSSIGNLYAANDDLSLNVAQGLLEEGDAKDGYAFLLADFDDSSTNPLEYRLLGLLAKASGRPREARQYFQTVITLTEDESLIGEATLELAQIEYSLGNKDEARAHINTVKGSNLPSKVSENIDDFLQAIDTQEIPKKYQFSGSIGWTYDSNANAGPTVDSVLMFGVPFTLSNDAKKTSDHASQLNFGFNHRTGITDDMSVQNSLSLNYTDYNNLNTLDALVFSGSTGLSYRVNDKWVASVPLVTDWVKIGHDNPYHSYSYGLAPQLRYQRDKELSLSLGTSLSRKKYQSSSTRDSENYSISPSLTYQINPQSYAVLGARVGKIHSGLDYYSNNTTNINAQYGYAFENGVQTSINGSYTDSKYDGKEAAYTEIRRDKNHSIGVNASYGLKAISSNLVFSINHTNNDSNLPIYKYDRNQASLSLRKTF